MSRDMVYETVPQFSKRTGETLLAGQNNATIILGRDRVTGVDSGYGSLTSATKGRGAGSIHIVAGRTSSDLSSDDRATVAVSATSDPDAVAGTTSLGQPQQQVSSVMLRGDCLRLVGRTDLKVSVGKATITMTSDGTIVIDGNVSLGNGAADRILRGDAFAQFWLTHFHPTPTGPSGPPTQPIPDALLSPRNKVL